MDDVQTHFIHFSILSARLNEFDWQNTPLEFTSHALEQLESTWLNYVTVNLKMLQQIGVVSDKFCEAHDMYIKSRYCIQRRIREITAKTSIKSETMECESVSISKHEKITPAVVPMVEIPIPIVVDLLRNIRLSTLDSKHHEFTNTVNGEPLIDIKLETVCVQCTKSIKTDQFVSCNSCGTKGHFGCLRRKKLLRKKADTLLWKCQKCLRCQCCHGTCNTVRTFFVVHSYCFRTFFHFPSIFQQGALYTCLSCRRAFHLRCLRSRWTVVDKGISKCDECQHPGRR